MDREKINDLRKGNRMEAAKEVSAADIAWQMFKKSGNINYYRLYSDLKKKDE